MSTSRGAGELFKKGHWHQQRQFFAPKRDATKAQNSESLRTVVPVCAGIARGYLEDSGRCAVVTPSSYRRKILDALRSV
jgi:hypothetical protein